MDQSKENFSAKPEWQERQRAEQHDLKKKYLAHFMKQQLREKQQMNQQMKLEKQREMLEQRKALEQCKKDLDLERQKQHEEISLHKFSLEHFTEREAMKAREAEQEQMEEKHRRQIVMEKDNWAAMVRDTEAEKQRQLQRRKDIVADMLAKKMQHTQKWAQYAAEIELKRKQMEVLEQERQRVEQKELQRKYDADFMMLQLREKEQIDQQMKLVKEREILEQRQALERYKKDLELERQKQLEQKISLRKFYMENVLDKEAMKAREAEQEQIEEKHQRQIVMEKDNWAAMVRDTEAEKQKQLQRRNDNVADMLAKKMQDTQKLDQYAAEIELKREQMKVLEQERQRAEQHNLKKKCLADCMMLQLREKEQIDQQMKLVKEREILEQRQALERYKKDLELERQKQLEQKISLRKFYMENVLDKEAMKAREAEQEQIEEKHQRQIVMEKDNWAAMVRDTEAEKQKQLQRRNDNVADMLAKKMQDTQKLDQYAAEIELKREQMKVLEQERQRAEQHNLKKKCLADCMMLQLREKEHINQQMKLIRQREILEQRQALERYKKDLELERQKQLEDKISLRKFYMENVLDKEAMKAREAEQEQIEEKHQRQIVMEKDNWAAMVRDTEAEKQKQLQRRNNIVADMLTKKMQDTQKLDQYAAEIELKREQMKVLEQERQRVEQHNLKKKCLADCMMLQLREKEQIDQQMKLVKEREILEQRQALERYKKDLELERQKQHEQKISLRKFYKEHVLDKKAMKAREAEQERIEEKHRRQIVMEKDNWAAMVRDTEAEKQSHLQRRKDMVADMLSKKMQRTQKLDQYAAEIELRRKQMEVLGQERQRVEQEELQRKYDADFMMLQLREKEQINQKMKLDREREILEQRPVLERYKKDLELEKDNSMAMDRDTEADKQIIRAERELERTIYLQQREARIEMGCGPGPNTGGLREADLAPGVIVAKIPDYVKSPNQKFRRFFGPKHDLQSTKYRLGFL